MGNAGDGKQAARGDGDGKSDAANKTNSTAGTCSSSCPGSNLRLGCVCLRAESL